MIANANEVQVLAEKRAIAMALIDIPAAITRVPDNHKINVPIVPG